ncbi:MAG: hypothetical protein NT060_00740 [Candidatus Omnitrophica bacterium]|nr:hypothetical protein [Candidatus Omnitrophota bacterium]
MIVKRNLTFKILIFLISTDLMETVAQFCFKKSVAGVHFLNAGNISGFFLFLKTVLPSPFLWVGLITVLAIFITWATILSKIDLSVAVPVASFSYVTIPLVCSIFLHERISALRGYGIFCILVGVVLVSASTRHKEKRA